MIQSGFRGGPLRRNDTCERRATPRVHLIDAFGGTPIVNIKPYIPPSDPITDARQRNRLRPCTKRFQLLLGVAPVYHTPAGRDGEG